VLVLDKIKEYNNNGTFYPAWGTCLGFERLAVFTAEDPDDVLEEYGAHTTIPITEFIGNPKQTKMFCGLSDDEIVKFTTGNYTMNSHSFSISPDTFETDEGLSSFWNVTSKTTAENGREFISTMEAKDYPIMATQFHPEKPSQVWNKKAVNHSWESLQLNQMFGEKFV